MGPQSPYGVLRGYGTPRSLWDERGGYGVGDVRPPHTLLWGVPSFSPPPRPHSFAALGVDIGIQGFPRGSGSFGVDFGIGRERELLRMPGARPDVGQRQPGHHAVHRVLRDPPVRTPKSHTFTPKLDGVPNPTPLQAPNSAPNPRGTPIEVPSPADPKGVLRAPTPKSQCSKSHYFTPKSPPGPQIPL